MKSNVVGLAHPRSSSVLVVIVVDRLSPSGETRCATLQFQSTENYYANLGERWLDTLPRGRASR